MGKVIGIDLGTTNSCVAVMEGEAPVVIANDEGARTTPSVVGYTKADDRLVGEVAKRQAITNPERTIYSIKRFMGRRYDEIADERKLVPYRVVAGPNGDCRVEVGDEKLSPPEISAQVLIKLKRAAEAHLGEAVTAAVITVPAYFNDAQRQATKDAGKIAGLDVKRIVNEPTAAAMAYGFGKRKQGKIAVYDFGGGTFDISVLEIGKDVIEVKATNGDTHLGGDNMDDRIVEWLLKEFEADVGPNGAGRDQMVLQRLKGEAERAKIALSSAPKVEINLPFFYAVGGVPQHFIRELTQAKLEALVEPLIERSMGPVSRCLEDARVKPSEIDEVVLVGGVTRMPRIRQRVREFFGREPNLTVNPDEAVALGAAVQAGVLTGEVKDLLLLDVTPLSLGVETLGGVTTRLIERNTAIPTKAERIFSTAADGQTEVEVHIVQGERSLARDNRTLGRFHLQGIPPAPRGVPKIEVTFDLDSNGIVSVQARDLASGKRAKITITNSSGLSKAEVEKLVREAREHEAEDRAEQEKAEVRNTAERAYHTAERFLAEHRARIPQPENIETAMKTLRTALDEGADVREAMEALRKLMLEAGAAIHEATPESPEV